MSEQVEDEPEVKELQKEGKATSVQSQKKEKKRRFNLEIFRQVAEALKWIQRAMQGLELEEDKLQGMMNQKDIRERTRISVKGIRRHTYMRILAKTGNGFTPNPYHIFDDVADMEDTYLIAKDGEQRKEFILLKRNEPQPSLVSIGGIPQVETKQQLTAKPKKEHFWSKNKSPENT